jgi:hypothetical protein
LDLLFEPDLPEEESYIFDSDEDEESFYSSTTGSSKMSCYKDNPYITLVGELSFTNFNEGVVEYEDSSHERRVSEYISKLSAPQTELTYVCQHFGWRSNFKDNMLPNGTFEVSTEMDFEFKNFKKPLVAKASYKNKKIARMLSAAKLLRSLYISFP